MRGMGHTSPTTTLGLYAQVTSVDDDARERLHALVEGEPVTSSLDASRSAARSSTAVPVAASATSDYR